jgi:hypothetical protein
VDLSVAQEPNGRYSDSDSCKLTGRSWPTADIAFHKLRDCISARGAQESGRSNRDFRRAAADLRTALRVLGALDLIPGT